MKFIRFIAKFRGLYIQFISIIGIGILFFAAWITGNLPKATLGAATGSYDWHSSGSDWGTILLLLLWLSPLGIFEVISFLIVDIARLRSKTLGSTYLKLAAKYFSLLIVNLAALVILMDRFFSYCD